MPKSPCVLRGIVSCSSIKSNNNNICGVFSSGAAIAKSSACGLKMTHCPEIVPEYRQGLWMVGMRPSSCRIALACFFKSLGDLGCPCIAERAGITCHGGIGAQRLC
jgi:hypothetical protein